MENKSKINICVEAEEVTVNGTLQDRRVIIVKSTRGEVVKHLDEICAAIKAKFEE